MPPGHLASDPGRLRVCPCKNQSTVTPRRPKINATARREPADWVSIARENLRSLTVEQHFRFAECCKPAPLAVLGMTFREVVLQSPSEIIRMLDSHWPGEVSDSARRQRYLAHTFEPMDVPASRLRPWPSADGLPRDLTDQLNLEKFAEVVNKQDLPNFAEGRGVRLRGLFNEIASAADASDVLDSLGVIAPIVLEEFHQSQRHPLAGSPLTIDDGNARALAQAVYGRSTIYCLVGRRKLNVR